MHIGLIIYSQTGNTLHIAQRLQAKLNELGHHVSLTHIKSKNDENQFQEPFEMIIQGDPIQTKYDVVVFGAWVQAFNLCFGFRSFLNQLEEISAQQVHAYVTQHFPFPWMGGYQAISTMKKLLIKKSIKVHSTQVFNKMNKKMDTHVEQWITKIVKECAALQ